MIQMKKVKFQQTNHWWVGIEIIIGWQASISNKWAVKNKMIGKYNWWTKWNAIGYDNEQDYMIGYMAIIL